jgi:hypothetical protein
VYATFAGLFIDHAYGVSCWGKENKKLKITAMASVVEIYGGSLSINKSNRAFGFGSFFLEKNSRSPT